MAFRNTPGTRREKDGIAYFVRKNINLNEVEFERFAIQTHFVEFNEDYIEIAQNYVSPIHKHGDILSISEKMIAMCQSRIIKKQDIKPGFWAKFLSKFAASSNYGGLNDSYKFQVAINMVGLPKILWATFCSAVTKLFGKKGVFYEIVGQEIAGMDGLSRKPAFGIYSEIVILNPENPAKVCNEIHEKLGINCMIVDANDFGVTILGKSDSLEFSDDELIELIKDNPAGQSDELTPFILIRQIAQNEQNETHGEKTEADSETQETQNEQTIPIISCDNT